MDQSGALNSEECISRVIFSDLAKLPSSHGRHYLSVFTHCVADSGFTLGYEFGGAPNKGRAATRLNTLNWMNQLKPVFRFIISLIN